jgi:hypothetical protein
VTETADPIESAIIAAAAAAAVEYTARRGARRRRRKPEIATGCARGSAGAERIACAAASTCTANERHSAQRSR